MSKEREITPGQRTRLERRNLEIEEVWLAGNRGTCGGVEMTLAVVDRVMEIVPENVTVYTNNAPVNFPDAFSHFGERLKNVKGDISLVPDDSVFIVSAHGVPPSTYDDAKKRGIIIIDTTCPIVLDEQQKVRNAAADPNIGHVVFIGKGSHPETIGVKGQVDERAITVIDPEKEEGDKDYIDIQDVNIPDNSLIIAKTTYAPSFIEKTIERIKTINPTVDASRAHSCYAVSHRQFAARQMIGDVDFWLVVGDESSHNSGKLRDIGEEHSKPAALITGPEDIDWSWFGEGIRRLGVSSGASVPERFTQRVLQPFRDLGIPVIELPKAVEENYRMFRQPNAQLDALRQRFAVN